MRLWSAHAPIAPGLSRHRALQRESGWPVPGRRWKRRRPSMGIYPQERVYVAFWPETGQIGVKTIWWASVAQRPPRPMWTPRHGAIPLKRPAIGKRQFLIFAWHATRNRPAASWRGICEVGVRQGKDLPSIKGLYRAAGVAQLKREHRDGWLWSVVTGRARAPKRCQR